MHIPQDVEVRVPQLSAEMTMWAYHAVGSFAARLNSRDRLELAKDVVQNTWLQILQMKEPAAPIQNWGAYLRVTLLVKCFESGRNEWRWRQSAGEPSHRTDIDELTAGLSPQDILTAAESETTLDGLYSIVTNAARGYICGQLQRDEATLEAFLEVLSVFVSSGDGTGFDTARQQVEAYCPKTPPKATCERWWLNIRMRVSAQLAERGISI